MGGRQDVLLLEFINIEPTSSVLEEMSRQSVSDSIENTRHELYIYDEARTPFMVPP